MDESEAKNLIFNKMDEPAGKAAPDGHFAMMAARFQSGMTTNARSHRPHDRASDSVGPCSIGRHRFGASVAPTLR